MVSLSNHPAYASARSCGGRNLAAPVPVVLRRQEPRSPCPRHASEGWHPDARLRRAHAQSAHTVGRGRGRCHAERSRGISRARWCPLMVSLSNHAAYASVVPAEAGTSQPMSPSFPRFSGAGTSQPMPPSCQRRLASRRAAAPRPCAAGAHGGAWARACHAERSRGISQGIARSW